MLYRLQFLIGGNTINIKKYSRYKYLFFALITPFLFILFTIFTQQRIAFLNQNVLAYKESVSIFWMLIPILFYPVFFISIFEIKKTNKKNRKKSNHSKKKKINYPMWVYITIICVNFFIVVPPLLLSIIPRWELNSTTIEQYNFINSNIFTIPLKEIKTVRMGINRYRNPKSLIYSYQFFYKFSYKDKTIYFSSFKNQSSKFNIYKILDDLSIHTEIVGAEYYDNYIKSNKSETWSFQERALFNTWFYND